MDEGRGFQRDARGAPGGSGLDGGGDQVISSTPGNRNVFLGTPGPAPLAVGQTALTRPSLACECPRFGLAAPGKRTAASLLEHPSAIPRRLRDTVGILQGAFSILRGGFETR